MNFKNILYEKKNRVAKITFNRPDKLNAWNPDMSVELLQVIEDLKENREIRVVVVTGAGDKAFMSGADIDKTILAWEKITKAGGSVYEEKKKFFKATMLERLPQAVIAAVNGYAFGMGCEVTLGCDIRIASEKAKFACPEIKLGIMVGGGASVRLPYIVGKGKAMEMCLTGDIVDAQEAYRIGLVNEVVPADQLDAAVEKMVQRLVEKGPLALESTKKSINAAIELTTDEALAYEGHLFSEIFKTEDAGEGSRAFLEKRKPNYKGR